VTHLLGFAAQFADEIAFLNDGVVFESGPAREIAQRPRRDETRSFFEADLRLAENLKEKWQ
jgi:polar amino acid transport system ATP-binding protein